MLHSSFPVPGQIGGPAQLVGGQRRSQDNDSHEQNNLKGKGSQALADSHTRQENQKPYGINERRQKQTSVEARIFQKPRYTAKHDKKSGAHEDFPDHFHKFPFLRR